MLSGLPPNGAQRIQVMRPKTFLKLMMVWSLRYTVAWFICLVVVAAACMWYLGLSIHSGWQAMRAIPRLLLVLATTPFAIICLAWLSALGVFVQAALGRRRQAAHPPTGLDRVAERLS